MPPTLFGQRIEPDFNIDKERRRDRLKFAFVGGFILCVLYLFLGSPHATDVFQGFFATILFYGENFYVRRRGHFHSPWLWKAIFLTVPLHILYLSGIFSSDRAFPQLMTKAIVFMPVLAVGFVIESYLTQRLVDRLRLSSIKQAASREEIR